MKPHLLRYSALAALAVALSPAAVAAQSGTQSTAQDPAVTDTPAGSTTLIAPQPSLQEEVVYLKDVVAVQTLRLDQAEELIARQAELLEAQARELASLRQTVVAMGGADDGRRFAAAPASPGGAYTVQSGDTLSRIARRNNTTVQAIAELNNLRPPYPLRAGATLQLPGAPVPQQPALVASAPQASEPQQQQAQPQQRQAAAEKTDNTGAAQATAPAPQPTRVAANNQGNQGNQDDRPNQNALPTEVGVRPEEEDERPYLAIFSDVGGILTPRGRLMVEPALDFTVASDNRFFFQGIEIVDAVLIGAIEATDTDRRALTESLSLRYGLTNRLEVDARIPYVWREDRVSGVAINDGTTSINDLEGRGIGDAEFGVHYQLNDGRNFPYTIANVRVKAPTGEGPFDLERDLNTGAETELAVGSGFWTIEPSLTFILASDPATLYANVGYQYNMETSPNEVFIDTVTDALSNPLDGSQLISDAQPTRQTLIDFDPGDAIRTSIGVGLSLNEKLSINFGYDQSFFLRSKNTQELLIPPQQFRVATSTIENPDFDPMGPDVNVIDRNGNFVPLIVDSDGAPIPLVIEDGEVLPAAALGAGQFFVFNSTDPTPVFSESPATTVGSFLFGGSYAVSDRLRFNLSGAIGATDEAPDARISLRAQYRLFD